MLDCQNSYLPENINENIKLSASNFAVWGECELRLKALNCCNVCYFMVELKYII